MWAMQFRALAFNLAPRSSLDLLTNQNDSRWDGNALLGVEHSSHITILIFTSILRPETGRFEYMKTRKQSLKLHGRSIISLLKGDKPVSSVV